MLYKKKMEEIMLLYTCLILFLHILFKAKQT
jgi:hypothetical protein